MGLILLVGNYPLWTDHFFAQNLELLRSNPSEGVACHMDAHLRLKGNVSIMTDLRNYRAIRHVLGMMTCCVRFHWRPRCYGILTVVYACQSPVVPFVLYSL
jgi:hypothetical protein